MTNLLVIREQLKKFYSNYEIYITPAYKFLLAFVSILVINAEIGYMAELKNIAIVVVLSLMCSFLPMNFIAVISAIVAVAHLYAFSVECAVVALAVFLLLFILYFRFSPHDTLAVLFTPLCFVLKIPYVVPIAMGLVGTPASAITVACGVVVYYVISYMTGSANVLNTFDEDGTLERFRYVIDGLMDNKTMFVAVVSFMATVIIVYMIRRLSIDYSWTIAMITGALANILILLVGDLMYNTKISIIGVILGSVVSVMLAKVLEFFAFNVDYSRTELVQFEDDEYYYYVKAVPKNTVATPQKRVKTIKVPEKVVYQQKKD